MTAQTTSYDPDTITLAELRRHDVIPLLTMEILGLGLTDSGLSLVKAAGFRPGDPVWQLIEGKERLLSEEARKVAAFARTDRVIDGIEKQLKKRNLRFGQLTRAVYAEIMEMPLVGTPEEPEEQPAAPEPVPEERPTEFTIPVDRLPYGDPMIAMLRTQGTSHVLEWSEQCFIFFNEGQNAAFQEKARERGLLPGQPLSEELIEELMLQTPPPSKQRLLPTAEDLDELASKMESDEMMERLRGLSQARNAFVAAARDLEKVVGGSEALPSATSIIAGLDTEIGDLKHAIDQRTLVLHAITNIKQMLPDLEIVLTALGR